jgi:DsbC/DsbD-like thiol-disulfide interchange protein
MVAAMRHAIATFLVLLIPAAALSGPGDDVISAEILPGWRQPSGAHMAAISITLAPGWKTYWRAPGDAGIPPLFDWTGSTNVHDVMFHWPVPAIFHLNGMRSIGYHDRVVIPMEVTPDRPGQPIRVNMSVDLGVCDEVCVPVRLRLQGELLPDAGPNGAIAAALMDRPMTEAEAGVGAVTCSFVPTGDGLSVTARIALPPGTGSEDVVIEASDPHIWVSEPAATRSGGMLTASASMVRTDDAPIAIDRAGLRFTVLDGHRAVDILGCSAG